MPKERSGPLFVQSRTTSESYAEARSGRILNNLLSSRELKACNGSNLFILLPLLCCGGPFIVLGLGSVGVATFGIVGGMLLALAAALTIFVTRRRNFTNYCSTHSSKGSDGSS